MTYVIILTGIALALLLIEAYYNRISVKSIRIKIHVNGTRGKSTITKYIAAALRSSGFRTMAKVTGEIPTLVHSDGTSEPIRRIGPARISEQFRTIRKAYKAKAEALVLECMSIDPSLQKTESRYFSPDIYVISNIKEDHLEKMGLSPEQRLASVCQAIPANCTVVSNDTINLEAIRAETGKKQCKLCVPEKIEEQVSRGLPFGVFTSNIEIAAEVAVLAGIEREQALKTILDYLQQRESHAIMHLPGKHNAVFLNAFPVNDPESANGFLEHWTEKLDIRENIAFIFNTRADRPLRTDIFTRWIREKRNQCRLVYITGDHRDRAFMKLRSLAPEVEIRKLGSKRIQGITDRIEKEFAGVQLIIGIGNIKGDGYRIINEFGKVS